MENLKFKKGDRVTVRKDLVAVNKYGRTFFVQLMEGFKGKEVTICGAYEYECYTIEEDSMKFNWTDEMFENQIKTYSLWKT